jgi:aspartate aminotransferase/aminotransferase
MKKIIADRASKIDASGIRKVFALAAKMDNPVNFSIGQPDFDVPQQLKEQAIKAILDGLNKYSQTTGDSALLEKISGLITKQLSWKNPSVLVTSGVSGGILLAFLALLNPGDEVIIPDPYFVMYKHLANMLGGKCVFVDTYPDFDLPVEKIALAITDKTKMIIVNSPCNPTGMVYSQQKIKKLAQIAAQNDVLILSDEIYEEFCYDDRFVSIAEYYDKTLLLRGFSKSHAMTGWRLGYAAANKSLANVIEQMTKIQQYTFVCAPTPFQRAAIAALDYDMGAFVDAYRRKRDILCDGLKDKFELVRPGGAFYAFVKAPSGAGGALRPCSGQATEFVEKAIKNNVLIIPGNVFSEKDTHFRISYATSDDKIRQGIEILRNLA